jgi:hypothetical protein
VRALPDFAEQNTVTKTAEGYVSRPNGSYVIPAEWAVSARSVPFAGAFSLQLGGGGAIPFASDSAPTAPRFRFTLSIRYAPVAATPLPPATPPLLVSPTPPDPPPPKGFDPPLRATPDPCKDDPESADGFRTDDGCPDEDSDKDGVPNRIDPCPLQAEDFAGPSDGCPTNGTRP